MKGKEAGGAEGEVLYDIFFIRLFLRPLYAWESHCGKAAYVIACKYVL